MVAKKIIVTGSAGCGKTTLTNLMKDLGVGVLPEAAREIIAEEMANEQKNLPWLGKQSFYDFECLVGKRQQEHECRVNGSGTYLLDRGLPDILGYCKMAGVSVPAFVSEGVHRCDYAKVLFVETLPEQFYKNDDERKESYAEALEIEKFLRGVYVNSGLDVEFISGRLNPMQRLEKVLRGL